MAERDSLARGARPGAQETRTSRAGRSEGPPFLDPRTLLSELALSELAAAGLAPSFDVSGLADTLREKRPNLEAASLAVLVDDVVEALTQHLAAQAGAGWAEVAKMLRVKRESTMRLLEAAETNRADAQSLMAPREEALLRKIVELEARAIPDAAARKALLKSTVADPLGYDASADALGEIVHAAHARLRMLDQALRVLRSATGRKSGGELHPLVHRLGEIWRAAGGSFTYTRDPYDDDDIVKGAFSAFCFAAVRCLPRDQRPGDKLLSSTIRKVREKQRTKRSA